MLCRQCGRITTTERRIDPISVRSKNPDPISPVRFFFQTSSFLRIPRIANAGRGAKQLTPTPAAAAAASLNFSFFRDNIVRSVNLLSRTLRSTLNDLTFARLGAAGASVVDERRLQDSSIGLPASGARARELHARVVCLRMPNETYHFRRVLSRAPSSLIRESQSMSLPPGGAFLGCESVLLWTRDRVAEASSLFCCGWCCGGGGGTTATMMRMMVAIAERRQSIRAGSNMSALARASAGHGDVTSSMKSVADGEQCISFFCLCFFVRPKIQGWNRLLITPNFNVVKVNM